MNACIITSEASIRYHCNRGLSEDRYIDWRCQTRPSPPNPNNTLQIAADCSVSPACAFLINGVCSRWEGVYERSASFISDGLRCRGALYGSTSQAWSNTLYVYGNNKPPVDSYFTMSQHPGIVWRVHELFDPPAYSSSWVAATANALPHNIAGTDADNPAEGILFSVWTHRTMHVLLISLSRVRSQSSL